MSNAPDTSMSLDALRHRIQAMEGLTRTADVVLPLGLAAIDQALPWGGASSCVSAPCGW